MITGLPIPPGLDGAVTAVGNCNTAMSMMVIGMILADINFKDFWDWTVVKYTIHRLVIIPASRLYCLPLSCLSAKMFWDCVCFLQQCQQVQRPVSWQKNTRWILRLLQKWSSSPHCYPFRLSACGAFFSSK